MTWCGVVWLAVYIEEGDLNRGKIVKHLSGVKGRVGGNEAFSLHFTILPCLPSVVCSRTFALQYDKL